MSELVIQLMALQVGIPLLLVVLNTIVPTASLLGLLTRSAAIALIIVYTILAGVWLFPPWWTPYALLALHLGADAYAVWRRRRVALAPSGWWSAGEAMIGALGALVAVYLLIPVVQGRSLPPGSIDLAMPLGPGTYLVTSGGSTQAINAHLATLTLERARPYSRAELRGRHHRHRRSGPAFRWYRAARPEALPHLWRGGA